MIRLNITSNSMPISRLTFGEITQTRKGLIPQFSCKVKFDHVYGQLDMSRSWRDAIGVMTPAAQLELCRSLVSKDWDPEADPQSWIRRALKKKPAAKQPAEKPVTAPAEEPWTCSCCGKEGNSGSFCPKCGEKKPEPAPKAEPWRCECRHLNDGDAAYCESCGKAKPVPKANPRKISDMTEDEFLALFAKAAAGGNVTDVDPADLKPADPPAGTAGN